MEDGFHCHKAEAEQLAALQQSRQVAKRKIIIAASLCLLFMIGETVGGALANSLAIMTDAAHMLTDFASFIVSLIAIFLSAKSPTYAMTFGWYRAEVLGALISVLMIWIVTAVLVYLAVLRTLHQDFEVDSMVMLITAGVGVAFNALMACALHQHGHSHGFSHAHSHEIQSEEHIHSEHIQDSEMILPDEPQHNHNPNSNINVRAAFIHVIGDFLQSIGVLIAAIIVFFRPDWKLADPICTFIFSVFVLFTTIGVAKDAILVLIEASPASSKVSSLFQEFKQLPNVQHVHNLRVWSLSPERIAISAHLAVDTDCNWQKVMQSATKIANNKFGSTEVTIQMEDFVDNISECSHCQQQMGL